MARGNLFMAHRCRFTQKTLTATLTQAGFKSAASMARTRFLDLWSIAGKSEYTEQDLRALAKVYFPAH